MDTITLRKAIAVASIVIFSIICIITFAPSISLFRSIDQPVSANAPASVQQTLPPDQPVASFWFPNQLLNWSPSSDPDAAFNRGNTAPGTRFLNLNLNVNSHALPNQARVTSLVGFNATSNNPSQGSLTMNYYALNYWQYIDVLVFFGGSSSEGLILAPNPTIIDAAHRNGVPILGNIFFPPTAFGGQIQWVRDLVQKNGSVFPVADKLIQVAGHYGFDGWFINQETAGGDAALAAQMRDFIKYIKAHSNLRIMWYDAMTENGSISWQNALNSSNDMFFQDNGRVSDSMFLNFDWSSSGLSSSRSFAQNLGRSPYDLYAGVDVQANGYNTSVNWGGLFPEGQAHVVSLGFYRPEWTYKSSSSPEDFYQRDNRFWVGANRDPSNTTTTSAWKGVAHYIPANSPINSLPFVTNFNTGQGHQYAINGQVLMARDWNNLSLQDVLPTWRWIVQSSGSKLVPGLDWSDAYYGGTALKVSGNLDATNDLKLFQTSLSISSDTNLRLAFKTGAAGAPTNMKVGLAFEDAPSSFQFLDAGSTSNAGWNTATFGLGQFAGKKIAVISLRFESNNPITNYSIKIGQIALYNGAVNIPASPSGVFVERMTAIDSNKATLRLKWTHSPDPIYYYNVYRRNPDNSLTYLGGTPNNAYFVAEINRVGSESTTLIEVEAVGREFGHSPRATTTFDWDPTPPPNNLALNKPATGSTPCNANEGPAKAFNGSVSGGNSDKWCSSAATKFLQVDLGANFSVNRFVLKHAGAGGESTSFNTRDFNIGVSLNNTNFTSVVNVTGNTQSITTHDIAPTTARYVRLNVTTPTQTTNASARIYEFEVYGPGSAPVTYETESLTVAATSGDTHRVASDTGYSGGQGTILEANAANDFVTYTVNVPEARTYNIRVQIKRLGNRGIWQFSSDGTNHGSPVDGFSATAAFTEIDLGNVPFSTAGNKSFRFMVTGRNPSSTGFWVALDYIKLIPQ